MGVKHSAVITKEGDLYTFGSGLWGKLGHGDEKSVNHQSPKLVQWFKDHKI